MTPEQQQEFNEYEEMFGTVGWQKFVKQTEETLTAIMQAAPEGADTNDKWQFARGSIAQAKQILGFEAYVVAVKEQVVEDELDEDG